MLLPATFAINKLLTSAVENLIIKNLKLDKFGIEVNVIITFYIYKKLIK